MSKADYLENLESIYEAAHSSLAPGGKVVFVTTTPISQLTEANTAKTKPGYSFSGCIKEYNAAAVELLSAKADVVVADLHSAVTRVCGDTYDACNLQLYNNVHFTGAGKQFCAVEVAKTVAPLLGPKWATINPQPTVTAALPQ